MPESSAALNARSRRIESEILRRMASAGLSSIAAQFDLDETTVGRWRDKEIPRAAKLLALLGLKATPVEYRCYDEETLQALLTLARQRMNKIENVGQLVFEDDE